MIRLVMLLSLYIHFPWCIRKCPYCDFNSHAVKNTIPEDDYIKMLLLDLEQRLPKVNNQKIQSIFMGGGTPSLFSPENVDTLLNEMSKKLTFDENIEITLEANPGTVEQQRFEGYKKAGINRLSLGIQSFNPKHLKVLGRIHDENEAKKAIDAAFSARFDNINLDIMFGLPEQTIEEGLKDLQTAMYFNPTHLSWYQLTLEPNTAFYQHPPTLPHDDKIWMLQQQGQDLLHENNFKQYEISAYSLENHQCTHNNNYWHFGDYLGIGAGAHSKITTDKTINRHWNVKHPKEYLDPQKPFIANQKTLNQKDLPLEFMLNALRLQKPIPYQLFTERTFLNPEVLAPYFNQAKERRLLTSDDTSFQPTPLGRRFLNELLEVFLHTR